MTRLRLAAEAEVPLTYRTSVTGTEADKVTGPVWVGIDPSLTGLAMVAINSAGLWHARRLKPTPKAKGGGGVMRLIEIGDFVDKFLRDFAPQVQDVAIEGYAFSRSTSRVFNIGEGGGVIRHRLASWFGLASDCAHPWIVTPTGLKKFVTGKGTGPKNVIMLNVFKRWDVDTADDNVADAYAVARVCRAKCTDEDVTTFQKASLAKVVRQD